MDTICLLILRAKSRLKLKFSVSRAYYLGVVGVELLAGCTKLGLAPIAAFLVSSTSYWIERKMLWKLIKTSK